ncbi:MAG: aldo/keto reductase [Clostridia bacterium]|nr:aldo/keto reductase [Clostridia bacterium]
METRKFRDTDLQISLLGLGAMRLPKLEPDKGNVDDARAKEMLDYALAHGINYLDTAYMYHDGDSERFLGDALVGYDRASYYLADKLPIWMVKEQGDLEKIFSEQLRRLRTDYIDFYLCHSQNKAHFAMLKEYKLYEFLSQKKAEGKIRYLGFSFHDSPEVLEEILNAYEWDFVQIQLNYADWEIQNAKRQYEILAERGIPCIVMEPVRGGALADVCPEANERFKAARPDASIASWAIRYAASKPNVMTVLSGMSNMEQLKDNIATMSPFEPLSAEEEEICARAAHDYRMKDVIPCTACRYCMDCPAGVDIPAMFAMFNEYAMNKRRGKYAKDLTAADPATRPHNCVACGECAIHCPQHIDIPAKMAELTRLEEKLVK